MLKQFHKVGISQGIDADGSVFFPKAFFLSWFVEAKQRHGESHYSEISWDLWAKRLNRLAKHGKATKNHPSISQHSYNLRLFVLPYRLVFSYCVQHQHCQEEEHQIMCNVYIILRYINSLYYKLIYKYHKYHQANSEYFYNQPEKKTEEYGEHLATGRVAPKPCGWSLWDCLCFCTGPRHGKIMISCESWRFMVKSSRFSSDTSLIHIFFGSQTPACMYI